MDPVTIGLGILMTIINSNQTVAPWVTELADLFKSVKAEGRTELTQAEMDRSQAIQDGAVDRWRNRTPKRA